MWQAPQQQILLTCYRWCKRVLHQPPCTEDNGLLWGQKDVSWPALDCKLACHSAEWHTGRNAKVAAQICFLFHATANPSKMLSKPHPHRETGYNFAWWKLHSPQFSEFPLKVQLLLPMLEKTLPYLISAPHTQKPTVDSIPYLPEGLVSQKTHTATPSTARLRFSLENKELCTTNINGKASFLTTGAAASDMLKAGQNQLVFETIHYFTLFSKDMMYSAESINPITYEWKYILSSCYYFYSP